MLGTTGYQAWGNSINTFSMPIAATSITASSTLNIAGASTFNNITVNGTITGTNFTKTLVGLGNVDNTSDLNKPVSTATTTALATKQNILYNFGGTGHELLTVNYIKRIFGKAPLSVTTYFDVNAQADTRNGNIQIESTLKWYAGSLIVNASTVLFSSSTRNNGGISMNIRTIIMTLPTGLFTNIPRIYLNQGSGNSLSHTSILRIYAIEPSISSFKIVITDVATAQDFDIHWMAIDENTMGMD